MTNPTKPPKPADPDLKKVMITGAEDALIDFVEVLGRTRDFMQAAYEFAKATMTKHNAEEIRKMLAEPESEEAAEALITFVNRCKELALKLPDIWDRPALMRHDLQVLTTMTPDLSDVITDQNGQTN